MPTAHNYPWPLKRSIRDTGWRPGTVVEIFGGDQGIAGQDAPIGAPIGTATVDDREELSFTIPARRGRGQHGLIARGPDGRCIRFGP